MLEAGSSLGPGPQTSLYKGANDPPMHRSGQSWPPPTAILNSHVFTPGSASERHPSRSPPVQGYNIIAFINYDTKQALQTGLSPRKGTDPKKNY